jgi:hypothetical protein
MRELALVAAVLLAVAGGGCITDRVLVEQEGRVVVDHDVVARAAARTATARGLPFVRTVPLEVMSVEELEAWLNRYYDRAQAALKRRDRFLHKLGILPPTRDSASTWKGFVGGFAGGIYDDDRPGPDGQRGTMILVRDYAWWAKVQLDLFGLLTGVDYAYEVFLTHELTHALQDQHLHLDRLLDDAGDDDVRMVQKAILESDANVIGMAHFAGIDLEATAPRAAFFAFLRYNNFLNGPLMQVAAGRTPSFFSRQTFSQYELGLGFVEERLNAGDWQRLIGDDDDGAMAELSRSYVRVPGTASALPESTEQLLFPWKRGATPDRPLRLRPLRLDDRGDDDDVTRVGGFEVIDSGVFGALALKHWLEGPLQIGAEPVVDGWGGDRYEVLVDDDGETLLFWRLLGDSAGDAAQLAWAIRERLVRAHGPDRLDIVEELRGEGSDRFLAVVRPAAEERRFIRTRRPEHLLVERRGEAVVVVLGLPETTPLDDVVARLFAETVAAAETPEDDARRAAVAADLERTLSATLAMRPAPTAPSLLDQVVLPARTMAVRVGTEAVVVNDTTRWLPAGEGRWGVRPWLELALPLAATVQARSGPFLGAIGLAPQSTPLFDPIAGVWSGRIVATGAGAVGDLGAILQLEASPTLAPATASEGNTGVAARAGLVLRPLPGLTLQPGLEWSDGTVGLDGDAAVVDGVRLGGVVQRGFVDTPLVELELVRGLRLALTATQSWSKTPPAPRPGFGLVPRELRFGAGLLLIF